MVEDIVLSTVIAGILIILLAFIPRSRREREKRQFRETENEGRSQD